MIDILYDTAWGSLLLSLRYPLDCGLLSVTATVDEKLSLCWAAQGQNSSFKPGQNKEELIRSFYNGCLTQFFKI